MDFARLFIRHLFKLDIDLSYKSFNFSFQQRTYSSTFQFSIRKLVILWSLLQHVVDNFTIRLFDDENTFLRT